MIDLDVHLPAVAAGDARAFGAWVAGAEGPVRDGLRGFAAAVDVEAVLQEALLRAWSVAPRLAPDGRANALLRFTVRAARNLALSEARRRGRVAPADDEAAFQRRLDALKLHDSFAIRVLAIDQHKGGFSNGRRRIAHARDLAKGL